MFDEVISWHITVRSSTMLSKVVKTRPNLCLLSAIWGCASVRFVGFIACSDLVKRFAVTIKIVHRTEALLALAARVMALVRLQMA